MMTFQEISDKIKSVFSETLIDSEQMYLTISPKDWLEVAKYIKEDDSLCFDMLSCLSSVDGEDLGFYVAYNFYSTSLKHQLEVRVYAENMVIPSVESLWRTADWHEREAYDLMGIKFEGHPDMRRIFLPEDWDGHPLQKKYKEPDYYHGMPVPKDKSEWE
tara:strand:+ start:215 stop:694 length:480 start_codon:yes stop_codon:yes gene_type:complete